MSTVITDFWKTNRSFWITPPSKQKEVDEIIYKQFWNYDCVLENVLGKIIFLDQFSRHFARLGLFDESEVENNRYLAIDIVQQHYDTLQSFDEVEIIFALMPFKHLKKYDFIFNYLHNTWLPIQKDNDLTLFPYLQKFYIDTYKKAFTLDTVKANLITSHTSKPYNPSLICDYYPDKYTTNWHIDLDKDEKLLNLLDVKRKVIVSLSGGVDSMVLLALLKSVGADVSAVHIVYGNREESEHEYNFLAEYCSKLGVPLTVYRIQWLRRGKIDRQFYEEMTRILRFTVYKAASDLEEPCVLLGHIKDDIVENIWTNIAHCHHLGNLKKMEAEEVQLGVRILRPLLLADKSDIYAVSEKIGIPYLKNTTPSWSNRGKFREHFHTATISQFGDSIDSKIIEFADAIQAQNALLSRLLYEPIYNSFKDNVVNITSAYKANLDATSWLKIFETICHKHLGISRPSIKCIRDFCIRLARPWIKLNCEMGRDFKVCVFRLEHMIFMEFFVLK